MSASLLVDLGGTCQLGPTLAPIGDGTSGIIHPGSGAFIGMNVNMGNADTFCNLLVTGRTLNASGELRIAVQTSDTTTSGSFTDPTSGLAQFPTPFVSGGILVINSGGLSSGYVDAQGNLQCYQSGFAIAAGFQRPQAGQYVRANVLSGFFWVGELNALFVANLRTIGSGGGYSQSPSWTSGQNAVFV